MRSVSRRTRSSPSRNLSHKAVVVLWWFGTACLVPIEATLPMKFRFRPPFGLSKMDKQLSMLGKADFAVKVYDTVLSANALKLKEDELEKAAEVFIKAAEIRTTFDREARQFGACGLKNLAANDDNRQAMWADMKVRNALLNCATLDPEETADEETINCALEAFASLALDPVNRGPMWFNPRVRIILVGRAKTPANFYDARKHALAALRNMAVNKLVAKLMWLDIWGARRAFIQGARLDDSEQKYKVTINALEGLANLAMVKCQRTAMWTNQNIHAIILQAIAFTLPLCDQKNEIRAAGLGLLANLGMDKSNANDIWPDSNKPIKFWIWISSLPLSESDLQPYLDKKYVLELTTAERNAMEAAQSAVDDADSICTSVTQKALECMNALAFTSFVAVRMWTEPTKTVLLVWAETSGCDDCRLWAIYTVNSMASNEDMRLDLWNDRAGPMFVRVSVAESECESVRFLGYEGLWEIAGSKDTQRLMWNSTDTQQTIMVGMSFKEVNPSAIRSVAFGVLRRLTTNPIIAKDTWQNDISVRKNVIRASRMTGSENILTRQFALGIMYEWSNPDLLLGAEMYSDNPLKQTIFTVAVNTEPWMRTCQLQAVGTLRNWAIQMRIILWQDGEGARDILLRVANYNSRQHQRARALAMCALQELSQARPNRDLTRYCAKMLA